MDKDLISRKAVQDMIDRIAEMHPYRQIGKPETYSEYNEAWEDAVNRIGAELNDLPSAQPYTEEEIQAMQDLEQAQFDKAYQIGVEEGLQSAQPEHTETHSCDCERTETRDDAQPRWIPFETREPDAEEKQEHPEWDFVLCGKLPQDGQRILVNIKCKGHEAVQMDEYNDDGRECYLYSGYDIATEATAWMPLPEPYKGGQDD